MIHTIAYLIFCMRQQNLCGAEERQCVYVIIHTMCETVYGLLQVMTLNTIYVSDTITHDEGTLTLCSSYQMSPLLVTLSVTPQFDGLTRKKRE